MYRAKYGFSHDDDYNNDFNSTTPTTTLQPRLHGQANCQFLVKYIFYGFNLFCRPILYALSALPIPHPRHARGLGLDNTKVTRPKASNFFILCYVPLPLDMLGGLSMPI
jgi:hypothetical protein